jgi:hypothetical protein
VRGVGYLLKFVVMSGCKPTFAVVGQLLSNIFIPYQHGFYSNPLSRNTNCVVRDDDDSVLL